MKQPIDSGTVGKRMSSLSEPEIFKAIEAFEQAGNISVQEFAKAFQISEATFYNWRKRYRTQYVAKDQPQGFIAVDLSGIHQPEQNGQVFAQVSGITIYQRVEPAYLKALL
jgi:transposase-like protein